MKPPRDSGIIHAYLTKYSHYFQVNFSETLKDHTYISGSDGIRGSRRERNHTGKHIKKSGKMPSKVTFPAP
jgi:hypothetical protein